MISGKQIYTILASDIAIFAPRTAGRRNLSTKRDTVSFRPMPAARANLMEHKCIAQCSRGATSAKRLAVLVVPVLVLVSSALAQVNEVSITAGRTFVSTQTVPTTGLPVHFGNEESVEFNYGRFLRSFKVFGLYAELPVAIYPRMDVNYHLGTTPKDIGALFVTPSVRVNIFSGESVTPWVSVGGGYGRFREAPVTLYENPNPGPTGTNTGVVQFGAGLDV